MVDFSLLIRRSKVALQEVSITSRPWIRADSSMLSLQWSLLRLELAGNAVVLPS